MGIKIEINPPELAKTRKLMVATPMYGGACAGMFTRSFAELTTMCAQYGIGMVPHFLLNESLITRARNYCADEFIRSDCTHLLFLDSDIGFNPQDVIAMLAIADDNSPYDIIGAPYPKKTIAWEKIKTAVYKGYADEDPDNLHKYIGDFVFNPVSNEGFRLDEPAEMLEIGTGFMLIRKKTFKKFADTFPQYLYKPDHIRSEHFDGSREIMMYFQAEIDVPDFQSFVTPLLEDIADGKVDNPAESAKEVMAAYNSVMENASKRYLSEDYWFCQKVRAAGMKVWICPWMKTQHIGSYIFGGSVIDLAQLGEAATADLDKMNELKKKRGQPTTPATKGSAISAPVRGPKKVNELKKKRGQPTTPATKGSARGPKKVKA